MTESATFEAWAIVELFGHQKIAGKLTDQTVNDFTERMIARIARDY